MRKLILSAWLTMAATSPTFAMGGDTTTPEPSAAEDFAAAKVAINSADWKKAITRLEHARDEDPNNADIYNLLGYSYRSSGNLDQAFANYQKALRINPKHLGAHQYLGIAYLVRGDPGKAQEQLSTLQSLCGTCAEETALDDALTNWRKQHPQ